MAVKVSLAPALAVSGVKLASVAAGIKRDGSDDLLLVALNPGSTAAGVFTQNAFCAAPVTIARRALISSAGRTRALLINSGNANAGTGAPGITMATAHCQAVADALHIDIEQVLPFSTGVIGQMLPDDSMRAGIKAAARILASTPVSTSASTSPVRQSVDDANVSPEWADAARCIMTTDTVPKLTSRTCQIEDQEIVVTGMVKGSGMIQPNMATLLCYLFADAKVRSEDLQLALNHAVADSFNAITIDSDTSTNDACMLCATGQPVKLSPAHAGWEIFCECVKNVALDLAQAVVRDAEGASKFITVTVTGGKDKAECKEVAYAVANSPLVKTAMFASDANVGRLLMAIGKANLADFDSGIVSVALGDVAAFCSGGIAADYTEEKGAAVMAETDITVAIDLARGAASASVYTSDLSHDYVSINADYRS